MQVDEQKGSYAKFVVRDDALVGYILLNRPENAGIYTSLIENRTLLNGLDPAMFEAAPLNRGFDDDMRWDRLHACYPGRLDKRGFEKPVDGRPDPADSAR